jgi:hypothetical protein
LILLDLTNNFTITRSTKTAIYKSGVTLEGSGLRILRYNAEQAEIEKNIIDYNSKVAQSQKIEEANFARMKGQIAEARTLGYYAQAGQSLMKAYGIMRDYKSEYANYHSKPEQKKNRAGRNGARRIMKAKHGSSILGGCRS